jgi:sugar lactone lactonase YvrE
VGFTPSASVYADEKERPLTLPEGVACNDAGDLVVADTGASRLVTYAVKVGVVTGGTEIVVPQLTMPLRVQFDSKGNLLALDGKTHRVVRLDSKGAFKGFVEVKATSGTVVPASFKLDSADNVLLLEVSGRRVLLVDADGTVLRTLPLPKGVFTDIAVDAVGTIFAVDAVSATVFSAPKGATEFKPITKGMKDSMSFPGYITASKGKLYVVDQNGMGIVILGQDGSYQGRQLSIGSNDGLVLYPAQLCLNANAEAFLADRQNNRVQLFKVVQ